MPRKNQHVIRHGKGWAVKGEGNSRATRIFTTQWEAIEFGRVVVMNQRSVLLIHNRKGEVRDRQDYRHYKPYTSYSSYSTPLYDFSRLTSTPNPPSNIYNPTSTIRNRHE
jgi:Uncharacterized protein conserved in bacteria (DUF2188)